MKTLKTAAQQQHIQTKQPCKAKPFSQHNICPPDGFGGDRLDRTGSDLSRQGICPKKRRHGNRKKGGSI
jgi:hypothetical protein